MKRYFILLTLMVTALACHHKKLCYRDCCGEQLRVVFDWSAASDAAVAGMRVYSYPADGGAPMVDNLPPSGGVVYLNAGDYNLVAVNNDTQTHYWRGESEPTSLEVYTRLSSLSENNLSVAPPPPPIEGEPVVLSPDPLWSSDLQSVTVVDNQSDTIYITPHRETHRVSYELNGVQNLAAVRHSTAAITGFAASRMVVKVPATRGVASDESATMEIGAAVNDKEQVVGQCEHFGCCSSGEGRHTLTIYYWSGGGNVSHTFDVSDQMHAAADPTNVHLILNSDLKIEDGLGNGSGFDPDVEGWQSDGDGTILL